MNKAERDAAADQTARNRAVKGWAFRLMSQKDRPPEFVRNHYAIHEASTGMCTACDAVIHWINDLSESAAIRAFLDGGDCPPKYARAYAQARVDLKLDHA
jgi:hypothetical protein